MSDIAILRAWLESEVDAGDVSVQVWADCASRVEKQLKTTQRALDAIHFNASAQRHPDMVRTARVGARGCGGNL